MGSSSMFRLRVLSTAILLPLAAGAQDVVELDEVVISGGITDIAQDAYGRAATVLDAAEIERRGIVTVQDALRAIPGVSVGGSGPSLNQVRIRGGEANHTLILIDGVRASGGEDEYILSGLETANIDRIEVLRGPQSVFFGSNASSGVINIITRKGEPGLHYGGSVEAGNGWGASAFVSRRGERGGLVFSLSGRDDRGFDESGDGGEKDGVHRRTAGLSGDWRASDDLTLGFTLRRAREDFDYDRAVWDAIDADGHVVDDPDLTGRRDETIGALWAELSTLDGRLVHRLEWHDSIFRKRDNDGPVTRSESREVKYRMSLGLDGAVAGASHLVNVLAEHRKDTSTASAGGPREMRSVAVEYRGFLDNGLDIQAGLRHDDNEVFRDFTGWSVGLSYHIPDTGVRLHASAGRAQVNPSFYELYVDDGFTLGNPDLAPERNTGFDLGIEAEVLDGRGLIDVTLFKERLEDEIAYVYGAAPDGSGRASYVNESGESPREGVEVTGRLQATDSLSLALNYTWLNAKNSDGSIEIRRPKHELGVSATYTTRDGRGSFTADLRHVAGNWDTQFWGAYPTVELPDATTVNIAGRYALSDKVALTGRIVNLFDTDNSEAWGHATQGRAGWIGLQARW